MMSHKSEPPSPTPPFVPSNVIPIKEESCKGTDLCKKTSTPKRVPMARRNCGVRGSKIQLLTNHFKVDMHRADCFCHYSVALFYEDGRPVDMKGFGRRVLEEVEETYDELKGKNFAYDGDKSLFTYGSLKANKLEFTVVLDDLSSNRNVGRGSLNESDQKRLSGQYLSKTFKVKISFASIIRIQAIADALSGSESEQSQEPLRVLDIILKQNAAKQNCLLVRQSFFHPIQSDFAHLGDGLLACRGFHSGFRTTQGGLSLNMDVSTTVIVEPGPVLDFLIRNQRVNYPRQIDWIKAQKTLKNLRIRANKTEFKITGLSDKSCKQQTFLLKQKTGSSKAHSIETTVYDYFVNHKHIQLYHSADFPCINVGKPKRPSYFPIELCYLISLQRYTKALSNLQRALLVEKSTQKPQEQMKVVSEALRNCKYDANQMLQSCGISINREFTLVEGRALSVPVLFNPPMGVFEESPLLIQEPAHVRVQKMLESLLMELQKLQFLLCILPEKNSEIYGPWKKKILVELGVATQCMVPTRVNDQYLTNVLLKINAKLGGLNSVLEVERSHAIPLVSWVPTLILGMDVSHGSSGRSDIPSVAAACKFFNIEHWSPKFKLIVAQKNHHTKFFQANGASDNVPAGTVVDSEVCHPRNNDFYLCAHDGMLGTTRPTHYHVLYDEIGFSTDDLQELLLYGYAHLAAAQMAKVIGADGIADTSSSHSGDVTSVGDPPVPELPRMDSAVASSMFFC
ncbi:Protein argonaute 4 [Morella rubra]|uniref:Protein argonaute 4 n=1 Tax=Morella rubra TaxID=262757 RepID=A0A6A1WJQ7_9ROSI|nr:Protein argonaute 4 [Morella rubra]